MVDTVEVHHAEGDTDQKPNNHADEDGDAGEPAGPEALNEENEQQHTHGDANVAAGAESAVCFSGGGATYPVGRDRHERQPNNKEDSTRHQGWEEAEEAGEERGEKNDENAGADY